ncbi:hypothetical protein NDI49_22225, partial [Trichocoleus sp. ST-U3]|uniref:hypothetical protein n=1 Tax=Coleofasciculus sp. FACHB-542 TaxID=2692787 RepID=UPI001A7F0421
LLLNVSEFVILHPLPYLPSRVFSFNPFIQNTRKVTEEGYAEKPGSEDSSCLYCKDCKPVRRMVAERI